jgi:hypothetical protein
MECAAKFLQKRRVRLGHLFAVVVLVFARPRLEFLIAGTAIALAGEAVRIASAGYILKDKQLSIAGPYAFTRNPLYVGSFFMYLGFCVAASNIYVAAAFPPFFFVVYYATILREEAYLKEAFGADYEKFCSEVPRFFPRPRRPASSGADAGGGFSFAQASKNKEYEAVIAVAVILGALWIMYLLKWHLIK